MAAAGFLSPKDIAEEIGVDDKLVRKFLRSMAPERPGKGGRWILPADEMDEIVEAFHVWHKGRSVVFSFRAAEAAEEDADS
jgi:hypothetical protein